MLKIVVLQSNDDSRLAMSPQVAKKIVNNEVSITIVSAAKLEQFCDIENVKIVKKLSDVTQADILISTTVPTDLNIIKSIPSGCLIIGMNTQIQNNNVIEHIKSCGLKFLNLNQIPRITRAQAMDVLSSQSNVAGYRAVIEGLYEYSRLCPMMTTAAGTIKPAKILVLGAGVAGLQAIATAKRMGAIVSAFDVRTAAKEQVESLGGKFIEVENNESLETSGGYAKEASAEYKQKQAEKLAKEVAVSDIIITTAQIPNKPAPILITSGMVKSMRNGSVIVDMAVESGGNCEGAVLNKVVNVSGVKIIGYKNLAQRVADDASTLLAQNILALLKILIKGNKLVLDMDDEIIKSSLIVA